MEFGLSTYFFLDQRLSPHILDQILGAGIRQIEIFADRAHLDYYDSRHVRDIAQWFTDRGVGLHAVHAPEFADIGRSRSGRLAVSLANTERRMRIDSMDEIKRVIEIAEYTPFSGLVVHLGRPDDPYDMHHFDAAFTSIEHLNIFAKERGAQIFIENTADALGAPERLADFIQRTRLDVRVCFDIGHAHLSGGVAPAIAALKPHIAMCHLHDNRGEADSHLMPFEGNIEWEPALRAIRDLDVSVPALLEPRHPPDRPQRMEMIGNVIGKLENA